MSDSERPRWGCSLERYIVQGGGFFAGVGGVVARRVLLCSLVQDSWLVFPPTKGDRTKGAAARQPPASPTGYGTLLHSSGPYGYGVTMLSRRTGYPVPVLVKGGRKSTADGLDGLVG